MKYIITLTIFGIVAFNQLIAQPLIDRKGKASFYSEAPLEDIEAWNEEVLGAIDLEKGTIAVSMFIKGFHFDNSLMEEHFNENYLESEKYPKATFQVLCATWTNWILDPMTLFEPKQKEQWRFMELSDH
ncbi:hypothetical protein [Marinoscillum sp.]|uniref:hypothetical protein n=1 Tax=Marinoscillum sp. TaxID=2024838 RepID=UPI003BABD604